jgi:hypothetical protein
MKVKCKICKDAPDIDLGEPFEGKHIICRGCGVSLALGVWSNPENKCLWVFPHYNYSPDATWQPIEISEK